MVRKDGNQKRRGLGPRWLVCSRQTNSSNRSNIAVAAQTRQAESGKVRPIKTSMAEEFASEKPAMNQNRGIRPSPRRFRCSLVQFLFLEAPLPHKSVNLPNFDLDVASFLATSRPSRQTS
jgi:hypothetical protein